MSGFFDFVAAPFFKPWAGNAVYRQNTGFMKFDAGGAGRRVYGQLGVHAPNITQTNVVTNEGFGGLLQGQFVAQSLMEPDNGIS